MCLRWRRLGFLFVVCTSRTDDWDPIRLVGFRSASLYCLQLGLRMSGARSEISNSQSVTWMEMGRKKRVRILVRIPRNRAWNRWSRSNLFETRRWASTTTTPLFERTLSCCSWLLLRGCERIANADRWRRRRMMMMMLMETYLFFVLCVLSFEWEMGEEPASFLGCLDLGTGLSSFSLGLLSYASFSPS